MPLGTPPRAALDEHPRAPLSRALRLAARLALPAAALLCAAGACARPAPPAPVAAPSRSVAPAVASSAPAAAPAPPAIAARSISLPAFNETVLPNGLTLWHLQVRTLPTVHARLVVRAGALLDRDRPGLAALTASALVRTAGVVATGATPPPRPFARPAATVVENAMTLALELPRDQLDDAVDAFSAVVRQPKLDAAPLPELRAAMLARASEALTSDPAWVARAVASRELLGISLLPSAAALAKISVADCKAFHKVAFAPGHAAVIVVGDVTFDEAAQSVRRALGTWEAPATQQPWTMPAPEPVKYTRVVLVDRPGAAEATVLLAAPGPAAGDPAWAGLWVAREVARPTGSACASPRSAELLALHAGAGAAPCSMCLAAPHDQARTRVEASLHRFKALSASPPMQADLEQGRAAFLQRFATSLPSRAALADLAAASFGSGLAHDHAARLLSGVEAATAEQVHEAARARLRGGMLVVVVGDGSSLAEELARLGDVTVLDPAEGFARKRTVPASPASRSDGP